jgi:uncharacterized membrane protein
MERSLLLARFIGPYIILIGIGLLLNRKTFRKIMEDFPKNHSLVFVTGLMTFVAGLSIVLFHNIWVLDWRLVITLFGWVALIKGAWLVLLPETLNKTTALYVANFKLVLIPWFIMLLVGFFLTLKGYVG